LPSEGDYIDQHPDALRLTLVEGDLDRSMFCEFATQRLNTARVRIRAAIIGASHVVTISTDSFSLHEVFACVDLPNIACWSIGDTGVLAVERELPGLAYSFSAERVDWVNPEPPALVSMTNRARQERQGVIGLVQEFPRGDLPAIPKTVITAQYEEAARRVIIDTAHSYPSQGLVLSRSILTHT
jgi:hypothetical protein